MGDFVSYLTVTTMQILGFFFCLVLVAGCERGYWRFAKALINSDEMNAGLSFWWYPFICMFQRFRLGYLAIYNCHFLIYLLPLFLHINYQAMRGKEKGAASRACAAVHSLVVHIGFVALYRTHATAIDFAILMVLLFVPHEIVRRCQSELVMAIVIALFGMSMFPVMSQLWLIRNSGNPNYVFFMGAVYQICASMALCLWACTEIKWRRNVMAGIKEDESDGYWSGGATEATNGITNGKHEEKKKEQ